MMSGASLSKLKNSYIRKQANMSTKNVKRGYDPEDEKIFPMRISKIKDYTG